MMIILVAICIVILRALLPDVVVLLVSIVVVSLETHLRDDLLNRATTFFFTIYVK